MALDWNRIGSSSQQLLIRPRDIFAALPNKPWSYLRAEQGEVLEGWYGRKDKRDVVIKQNTGGGTTVVGLAVALAQGHRQWTDEQAVAQQLAFHRLTGDQIITAYSVAARRPR